MNNQRIKKSVQLSLTKTILTKENKKVIVCPFACDEKFYSDKVVDQHLLSHHQHVLNTGWKNNDFATIVFWTNFCTRNLANAVLFQYAEKLAGKREKLELPPSSIRHRAYLEKVRELTQPGLELVPKPIMKGLLSDPRFPLGNPDSTCYVCQDEFPKVQLCPEHPGHSVCPSCAIRMIDTWLVRAKILGRVMQYGEKTAIYQMENNLLINILDDHIDTPCGICRSNIADTWRILIELRYALNKMHVWSLIDYKPGEVLEAHRESQRRDVEEQLEAARRIELEGAFPDEELLEELNDDSDSDPEYEPTPE